MTLYVATFAAEIGWTLQVRLLMDSSAAIDGLFEPFGQLHLRPTTAFAKGRFRTEVVYASDAHGPSTPLRREWDIEFSIV